MDSGWRGGRWKTYDEFYNIMRRLGLCESQRWEVSDASQQRLLQTSHRGPKQRKEMLSWVTSVMLLLRYAGKRGAVG